MNVEPDVYIPFYNELKKTFELKVGNANVADLWRSKDKKRKLWTIEYFHAPATYFYDLRTFARKGLIVDVIDLRLVKALEFIKYNGKVKNPYEGKKWGDQAKSLLQEFRDTLDIPETENVNKSIQQQNEELFLPAQKLVSEFCDHISNNNYFDAWNLLSPVYKLESIWEGDYFKFKNSCLAVKSIGLLGFLKMDYDERFWRDINISNGDFKFINIQANLLEFRIYYEIKDIIKKAVRFVEDPNTKYFPKDLYARLLFTINKTLLKNNLRDLRLIDPLIQNNFNFQRFIWNKINEHEIPALNHDIKRVFKMREFTCIYFENRWFIDNISDFLPAPPFNLEDDFVFN